MASNARELAKMISKEDNLVASSAVQSLGAQPDHSTIEVVETIAEATIELQDENLLNLGV